MLVSIIISFLIIIISAAIPIVHFIAFSISPFISGFIGASAGDLENEQIAYFGLLNSILLFLPLLSILKFTNVFGEIGWLYSIVISLILSGYIWFGSTIGALLKFWTAKK